MRKGLWSPDEDEKLSNCIAQHKSGSWSDIARKAGLQRCGKSCRRRWMNHLRPDLKHDKFSFEEVSLVTKLHGTLGNKWSKIATYLAGRTDNDVKNLWNTQIKKQLKNGHIEAKSNHKSIGTCDGFLLGIEPTLEYIKNPCIIGMPQQSLGSTSLKDTYTSRSFLGSFSSHYLDSKHQALENDISQYSYNNNTQNFLTTYYPCAEASNLYSNLGNEAIGCTMNHSNAIDKITIFTDRGNACTTKGSFDKNYHEHHPSTHMENILSQHQVDNALSISQASQERVALSNDSSACTINASDDISSSYKPSLYSLQGQTQCQQGFECIQHDDFRPNEYLASKVAQGPHGSSTLYDQWPLEPLVGYSDGYPTEEWS